MNQQPLATQLMEQGFNIEEVAQLLRLRRSYKEEPFKFFCESNLEYFRLWWLKRYVEVKRLEP